MALEKRWDTASQVLTANGSSQGYITVSNAAGFFAKQRVTLKSNTQKLDLEVKRVYPTIIWLGEIGTGIDRYVDLSLFTTADAAFIRAEEQPKLTIKPEDIIQAVYQRDPACAWRTLSVDHFGRPWTTSNPFPVQLSDGSINIGTVNAELEVQLSHKDNDPDAGDVHDSVQVGDGTEIIEVNPDGSINVNLVNSTPGNETVKTTFDEAPSVASGSETSIVSYIVPVGKTAILQRVTFSGENVATYNLYIASAIEERKRTHFGADLGGEMVFVGGSKEGPSYAAGTVIELKALHTRPNAASFNGRIQVLEIG